MTKKIVAVGNLRKVVGSQFYYNKYSYLYLLQLINQ